MSDALYDLIGGRETVCAIRNARTPGLAIIALQDHEEFSESAARKAERQTPGR